jgi:hypothetical protein
MVITCILLLIIYAKIDNELLIIRNYINTPIKIIDSVRYK